MKKFYAIIMGLLCLFFCENTEGQNIGIGTTNPQSKLDIKGNLSVGSLYSGSYTAPANGVIIQGQAGIGTYTPAPSAALDITSVSQGVLVPRMTTIQCDSISNPATGLLIYNSDTNCFFYFNGKTWVNICSSGPAGPTGATGAAGSNGTNGSNGATGPTGSAGSNGTNGTNGSNGATGATGAAGSNGTNGSNGATGPTGPTGTNGWLLTGNNTTSASFLGTTDNVSLYLRTNNTQRMTIDSAGNVGVGTTPLATAFSVSYNYPGKNVITIENSSSTGYSSMDFWNNTGALSATFGFANSGTGSFFTNSTYMNCYGNNFILTTNSGSYNIFILGSNGNVGINTNTPQNAFDVSGGVAFGTYGGSNAAPSNGMIVSGSVGIGTTSPQSTLDVSGGISVGAYAGSNAAPSNGMIVSGNVGIASSTAVSTLQDGGSFGISIRTHSGATTLGATDFCVVNTGGAATYTLPAANTCTGREYIITNHGTGSVTTSISFTTGNGATSATVSTATSVHIMSDGSVWRKVN